MTVSSENAIALLRLAECEPDSPGQASPALIRDLPEPRLDTGERGTEVIGQTGRHQRRAPQAPEDSELRWFLLTMLEVLDGRRPAGQLRGKLSEGAYASVLAALRKNAGRAIRRTAKPPHIKRPSERAIELCATIREGNRYRAAAARIELTGKTWLCTRFYLL